MISRIKLEKGDIMEGMNRPGGAVTAVRKGSGLLLTIGWISALLALFFYPFVFGVVGVIMGILSTRNGSRAGVALIATSIVLMGIGLIYHDVLNNWVGHLLGLY